MHGKLINDHNNSNNILSLSQIVVVCHSYINTRSLQICVTLVNYFPLCQNIDITIFNAASVYVCIHLSLQLDIFKFTPTMNYESNSHFIHTLSEDEKVTYSMQKHTNPSKIKIQSIFNKN